MTLEEAIKMAIDYEIRIRDLYRDAAGNTPYPDGKRIFKLLEDDEQNHVDYLNHQLEQWKETGMLTADKLESIIPPLDLLPKEVNKIEKQLARDDLNDEKQMLSKALQAEVETSRFYKQMVDEMDSEGKKLFAQFLEIEDRHIQAVQFELDYVSQTGYWFDFKEFDMEGW